MNAKEAAIEVIQRLPADCSIPDIMYALYVHQRIEEGIADANAGRLVPHEQVKKEIKAWLESNGP